MNKRMKASETLNLAGYDDLFTSGVTEKDVLQLQISELYEFKGHPFRVQDDEKMAELTESISANGVLLPVIVRRIESGGYEIISGHRRTAAARKAGLKEIPAVIRNYSDDEATIIMVDSNIQREELLPSEKAFAYKMKTEALKHQGRKTEDNESREQAASDHESGRQVSRYIRLTFLIKPILDLVDQKKIGFSPAVELSYLDQNSQEVILQVIRENDTFPTLAQAVNIRQLPPDQNFSAALVEILCGKKQARRFSIGEKSLSKYFPESYSNEDIENTIIKLLDSWSRTNA